MMAGHSLRTSVRQPGGLLEAETEMKGSALCRIRLMGTVRIGKTESLETPAAAAPGKTEAAGSGKPECQPPDIAWNKENI